MIGTTISPYQNLKKLGACGTGVVHKARDRQDQSLHVFFQLRQK